MSTPFRGGLTGTIAGTRTAGTTTSVNPAIATAATAAISRDVIIDIAEAPTHATIVRHGQEVATPIANPARAASILENFIPIIRQEEPRSVRQSIAPGTIVTRGTAIDIDLLVPEQVTLGIFEGVHTDLRATNVTALATLLQDPEVTTAIAKPTSALTPTERQNLSAKLQAANVTVDDTVPDRSLGAAITGLKAAQAFR
jgi:hypothetical protein